MTKRTLDPDFGRMMEGMDVATVDILYWMPDYANLLQSFVWQTLDSYPQFPRIKEFLWYWRREIDAPIASVTVAHSSLIRPREFPVVNGILMLN